MRDSEKLKKSSIYSTLLRLPLLSGASLARLTDMAGRLKLHFLKVADGKPIIKEGEACTSLIFVLSGSVRLVTAAGNGAFEASQTLEAPQVISPDCLFGLDTNYTCNVRAAGTAGLMEISKEDFRRMLDWDPVFMFNYLNVVCTASQRGRNGLMSIAGGSPAERLAYWATTLTQPGAKDIVLKSRGRAIHEVIGVPAAEMEAAVGRLAGHVALADAHTLRVSDRDFLLSRLDELSV